MQAGYWDRRIESPQVQHLEKGITAKNDLSFDGAYFDGPVEEPRDSASVVALFSPDHFDSSFVSPLSTKATRYDAPIRGTA